MPSRIGPEKVTPLTSWPFADAPNKTHAVRRRNHAELACSSPRRLCTGHRFVSPSRSSSCLRWGRFGGGDSELVVRQHHAERLNRDAFVTVQVNELGISSNSGRVAFSRADVI